MRQGNLARDTIYLMEVLDMPWSFKNRWICILQFSAVSNNLMYVPGTFAKISLSIYTYLQEPVRACHAHLLNKHKQ